MLRSALAALCVVVFSISSFAVSAETNIPKPSNIPVEAFAALPSFNQAKLSPSGKRLAYFMSIDGRKNIIIQDLNGNNPGKIPPWDEKLELSWFFWKTDDMLIFQIGITMNRMVFRGKTSESRTISFDLKTGKTKWLGKPKKGELYASQNERILDYLPNDPKHILMEMDFDLDATPSVYKVNIETSRRKTYHHGKKGINGWYIDHNSEIRLGTGYRPGSSEYNSRFKTADGEWIDLKEIAWADKYDIEGFSEDPNILYVSGLNPYGTMGLYTLDVRTGKIIDHVYSNASVDMYSIFDHPVTGRIAGVWYEDDYTRIKYFDDDLDLLQRSLNKALPNEVITIVNKARDTELYLVHAESDTNPGDYYFYNRAKRKLDWMASVRNQIDANLMAPTQSVSIPVRNGSNIPGYLTVPRNTKAENLPTIILPHGGPLGIRDNAEWDYEAQFYANRGYLVLKPNFRGSGGYGPAYKNAGKKQWGGLMQDDVTDATNWLIKEGMTDPKRICIVGSSYGGYAALMGAIKEPDLYKCAISTNGVIDMVKLKQGDRQYVGGKAWIKNMGLKGSNDKEVSPYHRAKEINIPVLLIAAKDDARVPYTMSKDMYKRMKRLKKPVEYVEIKKGTHHMVTAESRLLRLQATEKFLAKHIGQ